jgi:hypothetical protein
MALPTHFGDNLLRRIHSEPGDYRQSLDCILAPLEQTCDEDLGGVAFVAVEVALFLNEDVAVFAGEEADAEVVGEGAGGQEGGVLLAEGGGHGGFELLEGAVGELDRCAHRRLVTMSST